MLFALVSEAEGEDRHGLEVGRHLMTVTGRRSAEVAQRVLGFQPANLAKWKAGDPDRARAFTERLLNVLQGEFYQIDDDEDREVAGDVWDFFKRTEPDLIGDLHALANEHKDKLEAIDRSRAATDRVDLREKVAAAARSLRARREAGLPVAADWSGTWSAYAVGGWTRGLASRAHRVVYIYGARRAGKSRLTAAMHLQLEAESPDCAVLHLNVRQLVSDFRETGSRRATHQKLLNALARQLAPRSNPHSLDDIYDFDAEMVRVLDLAGPGPIYLIIDDCDAALRQKDAKFREDAINATKNLFSFLRPMAEEIGAPPLNRMSAILDGSRPLGDLARAYPASPLNVGTTFTLARFEEEECAELAKLAGLRSKPDIDRLYAETGGHRSLVWAVLQSVAAQPAGSRLADPLHSLDALSRTVDDLIEELALQPALRDAMDQILAGNRIDLDSRTRLLHAMYIVAGDWPACQCPLLEAHFQTDSATIWTA